ncbi:MAG: Rieske 2Fe-2S domain-containing protein [Candidatus Marinimicrobia bacterium]|jgi:glutamate synthase domain-containing protein 2|nr:Rieske 2Fe-2S domain-containing protein [Candidatus Neomarinimicrobiota bacterium]MBT3577081.1 Rieske 2Fe-2S domain-containing protein [Candidatus Neomarinimicrobiota bacterium]MBT3679963.1 Rieske 2Fe-2S domain-containing protein [Candidatus Neomarinimicrobiota bacterium]MBT3949642.1 Rieske 2Fe-2S domain-containing protein [Candidatus Neomarinimicrobiota bacterium]MBT4253207.1 Rieske 2Fe-2S domain-containing protein [Candidatus Neomarinimicrobiota bacterium]
MHKISIANFSELKPLEPTYALVGNVDLVITRFSEREEVSVLYGRCHHRGALLSDGHIQGNDLICGLHNWDYNYKSGVSAYNNEEKLQKFSVWIDDDQVLVDEDEIKDWENQNPQPYNRDAYQGLYQDVHGAPEEPHAQYIQHLAEKGLSETGHHGRVDAMGVPRQDLPNWEDIQLLTAQLHKVPLLDDAEVGTEVVIGPNAEKPLVLERPLFVSDMSFGALSEEAKVSLAKGAELAGTGICSGEGGMLPDEQASNSRYLYELASARFGFTMDKVQKCQAFHFKCGQGAKTGTGGHLPGNKVLGKIAEVRGLAEGEPAISPPRFPDWENIEDYKRFAEEVREATGGIPIGVKLSAQHIEKDIKAALDIGVDYIILDGRGGGTGAAPLIFRDNISVPTIPALSRARRYLDQQGRQDISLVITGGLRLPADFIKALALGADAIAVSNSAIQAIGCLGMRACHTNNCPVGIATQKPELRARIKIEKGAQQLNNFFRASTELMQVMARACGHTHLDQFNQEDLTTWKRDMADLSGVAFGGISNE